MKKIKKNKFAVIGGAGFLGKQIAKELIELKYNVKIIDKIKINTKNSYVCDIMNYDKLKKILSDCDYVFNFAGIADIGESNKNPIKTIQNNLIGSTNVFDICAKLKVKRLFFASTLYVYSGSGGFYKTSKQCLENILETYSTNFNLKYTVLRYGSVFGPSSQKWNGIYKYLEQAIKTSKIVCNGNGEEITNPCNTCNGQGKKQTSKKISVTIPKGVDDGTRIRLAGKGEAGSRGGATGDLYLFINVHSHELFKRSDENLFFEFPLSLADAALGTTIEIPTIDGGKAKIKIPDGTQNGKQFRLKGKGMPFMRRGDFGDLYVQVKTEVPVYLNKKQKELLEQFREIENDKSNPSIKKFFQKAKDFWKN